MKLQLTGPRLRAYEALMLALPATAALVPHWRSVLLPAWYMVDAIAVAGGVIPGCTLYGPVQRRFATTGREVWLTIDDGPHPEDTPRLLDVLRRHGASATFFVIGRNVRAHPQLARDIVAAGHELGNHSASHPGAWFWSVLPPRAGREIDDGAAAIREATGQLPRRFRAPVGMANAFVHTALRRRGLALIGWSARGFDGVSRRPDAIVARILRSVQPGAIIVLHEGGRDAAGRAVHVATLERLLIQLTARGYRCVIPAPAADRCLSPSTSYADARAT